MRCPLRRRWQPSRILHLSPRTLHRRLEDEGSSFQATKDALRRDLAINNLAKTKQALAQIAAELGFADSRGLLPRLRALDRNGTGALSTAIARGGEW
jgi:AraC-like DNA-binding protein